ncbi:MAG: hypothetical protein OHK93_001854 [Ramalina farinacea]|uniref:G-patch domain-containing protein n=1 Tax=Ramalina farinacea TaxID=258253 RepID=A0AA43TY47_9LECA|nr:hypothetical protein [Ramalina farinacea]
MAGKRSRATFEADLQAQQSPYVIYGTPLPPLDPQVRDDGSYVPVWKQEVTDEQGRKRLHGAFTGGFSAGYFNTVGSKEGWSPSTFVSSRSNRHKDAQKPQQRAEDFMDEEDLAEAEEAKKLQTSDAFAGLGSGSDNQGKKDTVMDLFRPTGETMGVKLLRKMGWREGQGVGPKVKRKAKLGDGQGEDQTESRSFAPENSLMISFNRKIDRKGLGFETEEGLFKSTVEKKSRDRNGGEEEEGTEVATFSTQSNGNKAKKKAVGAKGGFGMGILNDNGSDDEDPYAIGPRISYNRVIGGDKKKTKKPEAAKTSSNPLLNSKPVFISKKASASKGNPGFRRCHDGRLPIAGFVLSTDPDPQTSIQSLDGKFPPPQIPDGWKSSKTATSSTPPNPADYKSSAAIAAASKLSPRSRAALLGEAQLPSKSVFDYLAPSARSRIATATKNDHLPPALNEASQQQTRSTPPSGPKTLTSIIPSLPKETAITALGRGTAGWMPYAEDPSKRSRYRSYLETQASLLPKGTLPERAHGASNEDWAKEMQEFAHAARIFKPMTGSMAARFTTSSSSAPKAGTGDSSGTGDVPLLTKPADNKPAKTSAEEAAAAGMYGHLTRSTTNWYPTRLLCKRFNVKPPEHVVVDPGDGPDGEKQYSSALPQKRLELVGKRDMDELRMGSAGGAGMGARNSGFMSGGVQEGSEPAMEGQTGEEGGRSGDGAAGGIRPAIDPERNEALEKERPGEAIFKAIFGSESSSDDDGE